jgi:aryl-alcohol dehydrogenase-like predicted oxidoreductase
MQTRRIGSLEVSVAGLGCNNFGWRIDEAGTARVVDAALDSGMNFFDTADIYGRGESEEFLGRTLGDRRDRLVLATKFGMSMGEGKQGAKPEYIRRALEDSLRRLRTDRIDVYQLHQADPSTPIADTLGTLDELVKEGKVREIGCSNFSAEQIREADQAVRPGAARFVSVQNHYSMLHRDPEKGVLQECEQRGLAFIPYFPLANGLLSGKYRRGQAAPRESRATAGFGPKVFTDENLELVERLIDFAASRGHSLLELAFGWLLAHRPVASVIAGARTPEQVRANAEAVSWTIPAEDMVEIDRLLPETWSRTA